MVRLLITLLLLTRPLAAQDRPAPAENPLAQLKDEVQRVLADAELPFNDEQEKAIILMMEDRRKASEDLFGDLMDFRAGPTRGEESDRLRSALEWMRSEFLSRLQNYLRPEQLSVWSRYVERGGARQESRASGQSELPAQKQQNQTQYVRINNNAFTAEDGGYRFGNRGRGAVQTETEVIPRGGNGAYHGNVEFLFKDESLNAGRRFARNKPPYQERQITADVGGPVIPGRLTTNFGFRHNEAENVDTIHATLPDGIFALGITRPAVNDAFSAKNTYQLSDGNSLGLNFGYQTNTSKNQGIGGFVMPQRAWNSHGNSWNLDLRQFSSWSPRSIYETRFSWSGSRDETRPATEGLRINVLDAFSIGGAQNRADNSERTYDFSNLYTRFGEKLTLKTGTSMVYRKSRSFSDANFVGTFAFSSLEAYREGRPINYRVNRGDPLNEINQLEAAFFIQNDLKLTPRFTLMYGARYEVQTNISDHNNFDPRLGFAWGIGRATVVRGGVAVFHQRLLMNILADELRFSGRQYEIVIDNPSYPDAFQSGAVRNPSVWVKDPRLVTPYSTVMMLSYERTFLNTLFFSAAYDRNREVHRARLRNLNAPRDITSIIPRSCSPGQSREACVRPQANRGNILNLEPSAGGSDSTLRLSFRGRFSIFIVSLNYSMRDNWLDNSPGPNFASGSAQAGYGQNGLNSDNYNLRADWSRGTTSPQTLDTTLNARLPVGIFLTGTMSRNSNRRYTILTGKDDNQDTTINDRPPGVGRNASLAPGSLTFNFNISKAFFFGGKPSSTGGTRTNINLFANMTNAFNHPNYAAPSGTMTSPNFGKSTNAGDPREIEAGMRFQF
jgi:hypothetical protein